MPRARRTMSKLPVCPVGLAAALGVVVVHGAFLAALWRTRGPLPPAVVLMELVWARHQQPVFYNLGCMLLLAGGLTVMGWLRRGDHRIVLALSWVGVMLTAVVVDGPRLALMGRIVWQQF